jgi:hypothetical protein
VTEADRKLTVEEFEQLVRSHNVPGGAYSIGKPAVDDGVFSLESELDGRDWVVGYYERGYRRRCDTSGSEAEGRYALWVCLKRHVLS